MVVNGMTMACELVVRECKNTYAQAYAQAYLDGYVELEPSRGSQVQALYILSNLSHWRGETAKAVKDYLRGLQ